MSATNVDEATHIKTAATSRLVIINFLPTLGHEQPNAIVIVGNEGTLEKLPNQDDKSTSKKDLDDYYVPSSSLKDRFAKHWFISLILICAVVAGVTWTLVMNLYVHPRDFELERLRSMAHSSPSPTSSKTP